MVAALRDGMALEHPGLAEHLRQTVVNQVAIDQPRYSGFKTAAGSIARGSLKLSRYRPLKTSFETIS